VTDASGQLITAQNPVRQGALITLWMTGLTGLNLDSDTGLLQQSSPGPIGFAVAQGGKDKAATVTYDGFDGVYVGQFKTPPALWAGESAQFAGLDQIRVNFPVCATAAVAMVEKRYDAFMDFVSIVTGTDARIYLPFLISPGDPDCQWTVATTTTLTSSLNPSTVGQAVIFSANVAPSTATGPVTFFDGSATLGSGTLSGGKATLTTSALSSGTHSISAGYGGDGSYNLSTSAALPQTVISKTNTTTTLRSSPFPGGVTFTAQVSPSNGYATVMFFDNGGLIGSVSGLIGSASYNQPIVGGAELTGELLPGTHSITATYSGNSSYNGSASAAIVQTGTTTTLTSSLNPSTAGQSGIFTASVSPSTATGTVTFILGASSGVPVLTSPPPPKTYPPVDVLPPGTPILCLEGGLTTLRNGQAKCTFSLIVVGTLPFTAIYSGDSNHSGSSGGLTQTIR
jgi:hypothetical protein